MNTGGGFQYMSILRILEMMFALHCHSGTRLLAATTYRHLEVVERNCVGKHGESTKM